MRLIRAASTRDLPGMYRVCLLTGDSGRDASAIYRNGDLLGHVYVGPYLVGQPELALVVADEAGVAGYCLAARDTRAFEAWAHAAWWPPLREQYPIPSDDSPDGELIRLIHRPSHAPDAVVEGYPAQVHIDLLARARGQGVGRAMMERQLTGLREAGAPGVHLEVAADNPDAIAFYRHLGFLELVRLDDSIVMGLRLP
jgi:ribosomal protein S18 acetylase RimI-like enzyme